MMCYKKSSPSLSSSKEKQRYFKETILLKCSFPLDKYSEEINLLIFVYVIDLPNTITFYISFQCLKAWYVKYQLRTV